MIGQDEAVSLVCAIIEQTKKDYFDSLDKNDHREVMKIRREVYQSPFFNMVTTPDGVIDGWNKEYNERSKTK